MRRLRALLAVVLGLVVTACDPTSDGRAHYEAGHFAEAQAAFDEAVTAAGDGASAVLLYDQALAAVRTGRYRAAEEAVRRAREAPGADDLVPLLDFVLGNVAWLRSEVAEAEANRPGGEPTAHEWAVASTVDALAAWRRAAASRDDWPEARRNVERALLRLDRLREQKAGGSRRVDVPVPRTDTPPVAPEPPPPEQGPDTPSTETRELSAAEVAGLLDLLQKKEQEKLAGRRAERESHGGGVERDW
jgi:tetratricopeptide (TPR) repeat protein